MGVILKVGNRSIPLQSWCWCYWNWLSYFFTRRFWSSSSEPEETKWASLIETGYPIASQEDFEAVVLNWKKQNGKTFRKKKFFQTSTMLAKIFNFYRFPVTKQFINLPSKTLTTKNRSIIISNFKQYRCMSHEVSKDKLIVFDTTLRDGEQVIKYFHCKIRMILTN